MKTLSELKEEVVQFRDYRNWKRFHNALDLTVAMSIEASEALELLRFKSREEVNEFLSKEENMKNFSHEIADIFIFMLALCDSININLEKAFEEKLAINKKKYPIDLASGKKDKYNKL